MNGVLPGAGMGTVLCVEGGGLLGRSRWRCVRVLHWIRGEHYRTEAVLVDAGGTWLPPPVSGLSPVLIEATVDEKPTTDGLIPVRLPESSDPPVTVPVWDESAGRMHGSAGPRVPGDRVLVLVSDPMSVEIVGSLSGERSGSLPRAVGWQVEDPVSGAWSGVRLGPMAGPVEPAGES